MPTSITIVIVWWVKRQEWLRPKRTSIVSWEAALFQLIRWPWVLWSVLYALAGAVCNKEYKFKVTRKGEIGVKQLPLKTLLPYNLIVALSAGLAIMVSNPHKSQGYYYFALLNAGTYLVVLCVIVALHLKENTSYSSRIKAVGQVRFQILLSLMLLATYSYAFYLRGAQVLETLRYL